ncbi:MAG: GNAT family N-acetyltransferase [Myxococcales bacterium]|nr:GNAT family N-acetyltransferase [Myxococcales bacterium]MCB9668125.1 GNAT family N-acetyltransferase [Alphaproteobacteria bacterium]MCB9694410.1 GNAT family N-acetyltransferase [Alphaproteobacteria bacterium]
MTTLHIRDLREDELDLVTSWCMATVLETIPELAGDPEKARARWPNFTHEAMRAMFAESMQRPTHAFFLALLDGTPVAHSMIFRKTDADGLPYGYFFSRYVLPAYRRRDIASALMQHAFDWFHGQGLAYLQAHTHPTNLALRSLYARHGFQEVGTSGGDWPMVELRLDLPG